MDGEIILFDTDVIVEYFRQNPFVFEKVRALGENSIFINSVIKAEIQNKAIDSRDLLRINKRLELIPSIPFDEKISETFNFLFEKYLLGYRPSVPDMMIAASCVTYEIPLFTLNQNHFSFIKELKMIKHDIKPLPRIKGSWFK